MDFCSTIGLADMSGAVFGRQLDRVLYAGSVLTPRIPMTRV